MTTPKRYFAGTHRTLSPDETVARLRPFLSHLGITRVANVTGLDCIGIPTFMVTRPNSRSLSVSQGKGATLAAARASGIMEAAEQAHAEAIEAPLRLTSAAELARKERVVDLEGLPRYVREFEPHFRIPWILGRDLGSGEPTWVPYELVHLDLRLPLPEGSGFFLAGSNGLASGNHPLEAIVHGLAELVERDAATLFAKSSAEERAARRIDPASVDDPECRALLERYERARVSVALWDLTSDVGVACVLCSIVEAEDDAFRPVGLARGMGCHPDRAVAASRALTEAAQSRLTRIAGSRDDLQPADVAALRSERGVSRHRRELALFGPPQRRFQEVPTRFSANLEDDVSWLSARLRAVGVDEVVVVDLSKPEYPIHVVRVIAPGLEGLCDVPGYRPGRRAGSLEVLQ